MNVWDEYNWRGVIQDATEGLEEALAGQHVTAYIGFDPSASSLHVGSLLPIMNLARLQRFGHTPIAIAGGGTGLIGDPSGKMEERDLLDHDKVEANLVGIKQQLSRFLDFEAKANPAVLLNNADWLTDMDFMEFLREVGKNFTVSYMLAKESVKRRLAQGSGISFAEFCYMLFQAYDFLVLYDRYNCTLQMGGSDQWGNVTAGIDLIRRLRGGKAYGLVFPLVTNSSGAKFGKTESGTVWLDADLTSPFRFYQFLLNTDDRDAVSYLKYFTWLDEAEINRLADTVRTAPEKREAQRALADHVTRIVHGDSAAEQARKATGVLFGEEIAGLRASDVVDIFGDVPSSEFAKARFEGDGMSLIDMLAASGVAFSKSEARRLIRQGGIYLNNRRVSDENERVGLGAAIEGQFVVLRKGHKQYHLVKIKGA